MSRHHVFGYGSLLGFSDRDGARPAELRGFRRTWGVAMDNAVDLPGYKHYVDPRSGARPPVFVSFLDVEPDGDGAVNGVLLEVGAAQLAALDRRERNYERVEVTRALDLPVGARAWTYAGLTAARERRRLALARGTAVVSAGYLDSVRTGFRALGPDQERRFLETTDPPGCPVVPLARMDHGPAGARAPAGRCTRAGVAA